MHVVETEVVGHLKWLQAKEQQGTQHSNRQRSSREHNTLTGKGAAGNTTL